MHTKGYSISMEIKQKHIEQLRDHQKISITDKFDTYGAGIRASTSLIPTVYKSYIQEKQIYMRCSEPLISN